MALALRYSALSDTGMIRSINEDSGYAGPRLLVVADGVGGHAAGEVASSVAVASLALLDEDSPGGDLLQRLSAAVTTANRHLRDMVIGDPELTGMGTTLTALLRAGSRLGLVHVGDSRCYLLRQGQLQQITRDHTFVQSLVDEGRITPEEADQHPQRNVITNSLDGRDDIELDLSIRQSRAGDRYLLCSDGLSNVVSEETLRDTLLEAHDPDRACERLVELALKGGGPDNVTAIVADVVEVETRPPSAVPISVGAVADGIAPKPTRQDSPAAKAAALRPEEDESRRSEPATPPPQRRRGRLLVVLLLAVLLLSAAAYAGYRWSRTQYYVGASEGQVAIFQGLSQDLGPIRTSTVYRPVNIDLAALPPYQRERLRDSVAATGLRDAERIVESLRGQATACSEETGVAPGDVCGSAP